MAIGERNIRRMEQHGSRFWSVCDYSDEENEDEEYFFLSASKWWIVKRVLTLTFYICDKHSICFHINPYILNHLMTTVMRDPTFVLYGMSRKGLQHVLTYDHLTDMAGSNRLSQYIFRYCRSCNTYCNFCEIKVTISIKLDLPSFPTWSYKYTISNQNGQ